jgi:protein disulfide-isomerase
MTVQQICPEKDLKWYESIFKKLNQTLIRKYIYRVIQIRREKMKNITLILFTLLFFVIACSDNKTQTSDDLNWTTNLEKAIEKAKAENKAVLVNFTGSDWCKWCFKLRDEVFSQDDFKKYANENLILVRLDFPRSIQQSKDTKAYNQSLAQKFGVQGFPTIIIINSQGKPVAKTGYQRGGAANYVTHIQSFL